MKKKIDWNSKEEKKEYFREYYREYRNKNKDVINARRRENYKKSNHRKNVDKKYRANNYNELSKKTLIRNKRLEEKDPDKFRKYVNEYRKKYDRIPDNAKKDKCRRRSKSFRKFLIESGCSCEKCSSDEDLELHHKKYQTSPTINDVQLLCRKCHRKLHKNLRAVRRSERKNGRK